MIKSNTCDANNSSSTSTSEDSDDERLNALASEAVDPVLHKSLYNNPNTQKTNIESQGNIFVKV